MKKVMIIVVMLIMVGCTPIPIKEAHSEAVIDMPGLTKDQIYTATKVWISETFQSAKAVIENDDKEAGRIIGNGNIAYPCSGLTCLAKGDWKIDFTMRVDMKDQKMKITYSNLYLYLPPSPGFFGARPPVREDQMDDVQPALDKLSQNLRTSIISEKTKAAW